MELHNLSAEEQYSLLIQYRKDHPLDSDVYGEVHHVQPRSCGGTDDQENLVRLTPEEHYKAHALLPEVMRERNDLRGYESMLLAWNFMRNRQKSLDEEAAEYARLKKQFIESRMGHEVSEETRQKIREKLTGRKASAESKANQSKARKGKKRGPFSAEWRANIGKAGRGRRESPETRAKVGTASKKFWEEWRKYGSWKAWHAAHPKRGESA